MFQADDSPLDELVCDPDHGNALVFVVGVEEIITLSRQAMEAENNHPELLVPFGFALDLFFFIIYPIARFPSGLNGNTPSNSEEEDHHGLDR